MRSNTCGLSSLELLAGLVVLLARALTAATAASTFSPQYGHTNKKSSAATVNRCGAIGANRRPERSNLMDIVAQAGDPRIVEIEQLAIDEGLPLALRPETICALEDCGWMADPFTAQIWPDWSQDQAMPVATLLFLAELEAAADEVRHGRA